MSQVSRPVQILLAVTALFAVVWFVALRPKPADGGQPAAASVPAAQTSAAAPSGAAPGVDGLKHAIDKAHGAVTTASADAERAASSNAGGGSAATGGAGTAQTSTGGAGSSASASNGAKATHAHRGSSSHAKGGSPQVRVVKAALRHHKAVAIAFVDPQTADARAVAEEMRHVSHFGGKAVLLSVPLAKLSAFAFITNQVEVTVAPTVVIVDPHRHATTIVGYTDRGEIEQRLADALALGPAR